jgi:hypothetical protein
MKVTAWLSCFFAALLLYCTSPSSGVKNYRLIPVENPVFYPDTVFRGFEDLESPKFAALKKTYQLDTVFHGETDEFKRILLLRHWIRNHIPIDNIGPYPGNGSAESILNEGMKGHGFHCGHFMRVQQAIMNAYGYVTRSLGSGPGVRGGPDFHHGMNEVWLNGYHKWFLSDNKYDAHFEKDGIPLSALEIREAYLKNGAKGVHPLQGPEKKEVPYDTIVKKCVELLANTYTWIEWNESGSLYTDWPKDSSVMIMFEDDYFRTHQWIWDGKPHWAYHTPHMRLIRDRRAIEWTPNTITATAVIRGNQAEVHLHSQTPNLQTYQMKQTAGNTWTDVTDSLTLSLNKERTEIAFRTLNRAAVAGTPYRMVFSK